MRYLVITISDAIKLDGDLAESSSKSIKRAAEILLKHKMTEFGLTSGKVSARVTTRKPKL